MNVILLEKIGEADVGDQIVVKAGYARNYLFPTGKAVPATKANIAEFEARREELQKAAAEKTAAAQARADKINGLEIRIEVQASDEGKLFGSVGTREIADASVAAGHELEKSEVLLPEGALQYVGEYDIDLDLGYDVTAQIKVIVAAN